MRTLAILIIAYNEFENVRLAVESIRMWGDIENLGLILVDNHSTDGLREWAKTQEDFTYVYMDEGEQGYAKVINDVRRELDIKSDLLIMTGHYVITQQCLSRLREVLHREEMIGAVGGIGNTFSNKQAMPISCSRYQEAMQYAADITTHSAEQTLGLYSNVILFRGEALEAVGDFDEELWSMPYVMGDYCFRLITNDYKLMICKEAIFWNLLNERSELAYSSRFYKVEESRRLENKWGMHYFGVRGNYNLISEIDAKLTDEFNILEIGCDCGATLMGIKNKYPNAHVYGSELNEKSANIASHVAEVVVNNIEEKNLPYCEGMFDYIIFGDVLEHLRNPKEVLEYCRTILKDGGRIIASIPNLMHISVMEQLLKGNFTYTEWGLLDKTHIHMFTYNEIVRMLVGCEYQVEKLEMIGIKISKEQEVLIDQLLALSMGAKRFMYEAFQYVVRAKAVPSK